MSNKTDFKVFPTKIKERKSGVIEREERFEYQYPIIMKYLKNKISGLNIGDFFKRIEGKNFAIYAITEFTELVCDDLKLYDDSIRLVYICDRNYQKFCKGYKDYQVVGIDNLVNDYNAGKIDKVLICNIFHANEIFDDLQSRGIALKDLVSVNSAIFNMKG